MQNYEKRMKVALDSDTTVVVTRFIPAQQELAFDVWSQCRHLQKWMFGPPGWTMPHCEMDLRAGGAYRWGWRKQDGEEMFITGVFKEVDRPHRMVSTESWGGDWAETLNTMTFTPDGEGTMFKLVMEFPSKAARDAALETGMNDGMQMGFDSLDTYLSSPS
jgi:uncharacterized protein YndB with AHSA1/START domain